MLFKTGQIFIRPTQDTNWEILDKIFYFIKPCNAGQELYIFAKIVFLVGPLHCTRQYWLEISKIILKIKVGFKVVYK